MHTSFKKFALAAAVPVLFAILGFGLPAHASTSPTITTSSSHTVTATSVTLSGRVNTLGSASSVYRYFYFTNGTTGEVTHWALGSSSAAAPYTDTAVVPASSFSCGTTYAYEYDVQDFVTHTGAEGASYSFTMPACLSVTTGHGTVTGGTFALSGTVSGPGPITSRSFKYGTHVGDGAGTTSTSITITIASATAPFTGSFTPSCGATYYYEAYAVNSAGTAHGSELSTTYVCAPTVSTDSSLLTTATTGTVTGSVSSTGGAPVTVRGFHYGPTTSYGSTVSATGSFAAGSFSASFTHISCRNIPTHFQAFATNSAGTSTGADMTFTGAGCALASSQDLAASNIAAAIGATAQTQSSDNSDQDMPMQATMMGEIADSAPAAAATSLTRELQFGDSGSDVTVLQQYLAAKGYLSAAPSGYFGALTMKAVTALQAANGIDPVGIVGPLTLRFLTEGN